MCKRVNLSLAQGAEVVNNAGASKKFPGHPCTETAENQPPATSAWVCRHAKLKGSKVPIQNAHGLSWRTHDPLRLQGFGALIPASSPAGRLLLSWTVAVSEPKAKRPCTGSHALVIERLCEVPRQSSVQMTRGCLDRALVSRFFLHRDSHHVLSSHFRAPSIVQIPKRSHLHQRPCKSRLRLKATVCVRHRFHECAEQQYSQSLPDQPADTHTPEP